MDEVNGELCEDLRGMFRPNRSLIVYDEMPTSFFFYDVDKIYFFHWADTGEQLDRWLVTTITAYVVTQLEQNQIDLNYALTTGKTSWIIDTDCDYRIISCWKVSKFPEQYMPQRGVYPHVRSNQ